MECARWLFYKMWLELIQPNSFTFAGLLSACAHLNAFQSGKQLHGLFLKYGLETDVVVGSVMVDMYSECGQMENAIKMPYLGMELYAGMLRMVMLQRL